MSTAPEMPGDPGDAICSPYSSQLRPIHFEELDVDDNFGPRLVDRGDQLDRGGHALGCVADRDRVGGRDRRDLPDVDDDAEQVDRFLEVGVAEEDRPDDQFLVLAALRRRVGDDGDRLRSGDAVEGARARRQRRERVTERRIPQIDAERLVAERRVEDGADVREPADGQEHGPRRRAVAEHERAGQLDVLRELETGRRQVARPLDQALQLGLTGARHRQLRAQLVARVPQRGLDL